MRRFSNNSFNGYQGGYDEGGFDCDDNYMDGGFDEDNFSWDNNPGPRVGPLAKNMKRPRYGDAYGDYRGGYGPGGGFGPRPLMPGPPPRMPPPLMGPMGPMRPPGPHGGPRAPMWGRGFGPGGPSRRKIEADRALKYLMKCGVSREHLKNLPHDLLLMIGPEHCGLCDFSFESFNISRMHYVSKNHYKNQKKWLMRTQDHIPSNETPFKSRDLYCELCDIQITSKVHGEAHYDGKPHRGIVEGRKKPKNPLLLQPKMQSRFEQLVRREKRCLKPVKETAAGGEEGATIEPKVTSPELYCNICKTTVTCSEQMTMHLNGKKHLSKEKNHILNMVTSKEENQDEENEGEDDDLEENESAVEGEGGADEDGAAEDVAGAEGQPTAFEEVLQFIMATSEKDGNNFRAVKFSLENGENKEAVDDDWGNEAWENQEQTDAKA